MADKGGVVRLLPKICVEDLRNSLTKCRPSCDGGRFSLHGMIACHPWLTCKDISQDVQITDQILGQGAVKMVSLGKWKGHNVAVSQLINRNFIEDFNSNLETLLLLTLHENYDFVKNIIQIVGFCKESHILVTQYHFFGSADKLDSILQIYLPHLNNLSTRFSLCVNYVSVLEKLHSHPKGPHVLCDSNTPEKALSQFLLSDDMKLKLNDMDALPVVNKENNFSIKCGHRELDGEYIAPEQLWPFEDDPFNDNLMPGYNEKVDIWKVPDLCLKLVGKSNGVNKLLIDVFNIHLMCKQLQPQMRPTAGDILRVYESVWNRLNEHEEKKSHMKHVHVML